MRVTFNIIGWRDPSYSSNSAEGYGEWNRPNAITVDLTDDQIKDAEWLGFIRLKGKDICVDYDTLSKSICGNSITYNRCVIFLKPEEQ